MTKTRINSVLLLLGFVVVLASSCDSNRIYEETFSVEGNKWGADDLKTFSFDIEDTVSALNVFVNLRTTTAYPYSNLYMFLYSDYPDGYNSKDTLEFLLAKPNGEWVGENSGTVVEYKFLITRGRFTTPGEYTFKIGHAMRDNPLPEIIDVGMRVELMEKG